MKVETNHRCFCKCHWLTMCKPFMLSISALVFSTVGGSRMFQSQRRGPNRSQLLLGRFIFARHMPGTSLQHRLQLSIQCSPAVEPRSSLAQLRHEGHFLSTAARNQADVENLPDSMLPRAAWIPWFVCVEQADGQTMEELTKAANAPPVWPRPRLLARHQVGLRSSQTSVPFCRDTERCRW